MTRRTCLCTPSHARWTPRQLSIESSRTEPGAFAPPWHIVAGLFVVAAIVFGGGS